MKEYTVSHLNILITARGNLELLSFYVGVVVSGVSKALDA